MNSPLRKNLKQDLTTADIANSNRNDVEQIDDANVDLRKQPVKVTSGGQPQGTTSAQTNTTPLFPENELSDLKGRWDGIQQGFVDQPRKAVEEADNLVAQTMKRLADVFAQERAGLEGQWDRGDNVSTEDLRVALQRYRSFFQRLLAV
jgi:hypothetical protein